MMNTDRPTALARTTARAKRIDIRRANAGDRKEIYRLRHEVYTRELGQHQANASGRLSDALGEFNVYLVASLNGVIAGFIGITPPWAVSLPGQVAAVAALQDPDYYAGRYAETHELREGLASVLAVCEGWQIIPGIANFLLCHLPEDGPDAATLVELCRKRDLFLRDAGAMGRNLGRHMVRIAVKDGETNERILNILRAVLPEEYRVRLTLCAVAG